MSYRPLAADSPRPASNPDPAVLAALEARASGLRILLADDAEPNRLLIVSSLKRTHASIHSAENGAEALAIFRSTPCDVVLMDVEMPVMDGYAATREIRRFEAETRRAPVPVIALTAHTVPEIAERVSGAGFTGVLTKPISLVTLLETLIRWRPAGDRPADQSHLASPDPDIQAQAPAYLEKRRGDLIACRSAQQAGDFDTIRRLGHNMRGSGAGYGFPVLTDLGRELEQAALAANVAAIGEIQNRLATVLTALTP